MVFHEQPAVRRTCKRAVRPATLPIRLSRCPERSLDFAARSAGRRTPPALAGFVTTVVPPNGDPSVAVAVGVCPIAGVAAPLVEIVGAAAVPVTAICRDPVVTAPSRVSMRTPTSIAPAVDGVHSHVTARPADVSYTPSPSRSHETLDRGWSSTELV